jgi:hypothetical protein
MNGSKAKVYQISPESGYFYRNLKKKTVRENKR